MAEVKLTPANVKDMEIVVKVAMILRDYLMDVEEENHLIEKEEFSESQLQMYVLLGVDAYNSLTPINLTATPSTFPSLTLMIEGGAIFALKSAIMKYIRNSFQFNDSGVSISVSEKSQEYSIVLQRLQDEWNSKARAIKEHLNLDSCYSGFSSEYLNLFVVGRRTRKI